VTKKSLAGWVFRIEVVTDKPSVKTAEMKERISGLLGTMEDVEKVKVDELFETLKLFEKKTEKSCEET